MRDSTPATATFLFTDIEGSTQLLKSHRDEYASILADHHRILLEACAANGGREVDNQGDAFFIAFTRAKDAVLAAVAGQRALAEHAWPMGATVRVRMGIHTGEADVTVDRYVGLSVHRAARISAIGHGGQVLVSPTTAGLLDDAADLPGIALRSLGQHRLKDIERPVEIYQLDIEGLRNGFPPLRSQPRGPNRRRRAAFAAAALLVLVAGGLAAAWASKDDTPPEVLPNSLVRIDPDTLEPTDVFPIASGADRVLDSGGYLWVMHHVLRDFDSGELRNAGDHTITRVDPSTGEAKVIGGGLAPCGLTSDPSGDVWVANCFASGPGPTANVVRIDADSLEFEATWPVPGGEGFVRGLVYGGGSLWVADVSGGNTSPSPPYRVLQVDPETGGRRSIPVEYFAGGLAWSEGYGDIWMSHFDRGSLSRLHTATGKAKTVDNVATSPVLPVVDGDTVWVGDWARPQVVRVPAVGAGAPRAIALPAQARDYESAVWQVDAGAGAVWAATPRLGSVWRIDPRTNAVTRITLPYRPSGVAADDGVVWVTVRAD